MTSFNIKLLISSSNFYLKDIITFSFINLFFIIEFNSSNSDFYNY